jgi:hypothetical protein
VPDLDDDALGLGVKVPKQVLPLPPLGRPDRLEDADEVAASSGAGRVEREKDEFEERLLFADELASPEEGVRGRGADGVG